MSGRSLDGRKVLVVGADTRPDGGLTGCRG